jgi:hypothetical protein
MTSFMLGDLILESLTPSVNAPLAMDFLHMSCSKVSFFTICEALK